MVYIRKYQTPMKITTYFKIIKKWGPFRWILHKKINLHMEYVTDEYTPIKIKEVHEVAKNRIDDFAWRLVFKKSPEFVKEYNIKEFEREYGAYLI